MRSTVRSVLVLACLLFIAFSLKSTPPPPPNQSPRIPAASPIFPSARQTRLPRILCEPKCFFRLRCGPVQYPSDGRQRRTILPYRLNARPLRAVPSPVSASGIRTRPTKRVDNNRFRPAWRRSFPAHVASIGSLPLRRSPENSRVPHQTDYSRQSRDSPRRSTSRSPQRHRAACETGSRDSSNRLRRELSRRDLKIQPDVAFCR